MMYVPTIMLYFVGVSVFALGPAHAGLVESKFFTLTASLALLLILVILNIVGLGVGKWINNVGGLGTFIAGGILIALGLIVWLRFGTSITAADFRIPPKPTFLLNSFGVICFGLVGLELASVMGDEIENPRKTLPGAVAWGGILSGALYIGTTVTLLVAVSKDQISVLQGIVQAVSHMSARVGIGWIIAPFALMLSLSIAGIGSAWLGGSARIPFVAGLDSYMPDWLGKIHPKYSTPYAALIVHATVSLILVVINFSFTGAGVQETFQKLLSLAVVLQLIPFLYMFGALLRIAMHSPFERGRYGRTTLIIAGLSGLLTTILGIALAFFPAQQITSLLSYEVWMFGGTVAFIGLAAFFFFIYGRRKAARKLAAQDTGLWSFNARIGRGTFWATFVCLFLASLLVRLLLIAISSAGSGVLPLVVVVNVAYLVLAVWLSLAMQVKRWHDLNKSGWMVLINLTIIGLPIALVLLGFVRGTKGPNKYGSDPLQICGGGHATGDTT